MEAHETSDLIYPAVGQVRYWKSVDPSNVVFHPSEMFLIIEEVRDESWSEHEPLFVIRYTSGKCFHYSEQDITEESDVICI